MRWNERQAKVESLSYQSIDELSDEFGLSLPFYPEVYWIGRTIDFDDLGLSSRLRDEFNDRKTLGLSSYFKDQRVILINKYRRHDIFEESTHFLHLVNSKLGLQGPLKDVLWRDIFVEMLGFFGARFLGSKAINGYQGDYLMSFYNPESDNFSFDNGLTLDDNPDSFFYDLIYQQGYALGDILFFNFINGKLTRREIAKMFNDDFNNGEDARQKILKLRERFWPIRVLS